MKIKTFGKLTDIINKELVVVFPLTIADFKPLLLKEFPELKNMDFGIAVNHQLLHDADYILNESDEIALLPPFSGG